MRWLRGSISIAFCRERAETVMGPVLRRSAFLTDRRERAFAFPMELRVFLSTLAAADVFRGFGICFPFPFCINPVLLHIRARNMSQHTRIVEKVVFVWVEQQSGGAPVFKAEDCPSPDG
jgi:hypothetical protein